jgi:MFS family permease
VTRPRGGVGVVVGAVLVTVLTNMPVFLLGALATQIASTLRLSPATIGIAVGAYWAAAAVASALAGAVDRRVGERGLGALSIGLAVASLVGGFLAAGAVGVIACAVLGGLGNGWGHPSSNRAIATSIAQRRQGLAFGTKQAAVPIAGLIAGLSIPAVALSVGWPWAFAGAGVLGVFLIIPVLRRRRGAGAPVARAEPLDAARRRVLLVMACVTALAAGAANSAVAFGVTGAVAHGIPEAAAGVLLAAGSFIGAVLRIAFGALVDRGALRPLVLITAITAVCALGLAVMALPSTPGYVVGFLLAGGVGWSWPGLVHLSVSLIAPRATVSATGLVQSGSYLGSAVGPVLTGVLILAGPTLVWIVLAALAAVASALSFRVRALAAGLADGGAP